jgi:hypothetical protein
LVLEHQWFFCLAVQSRTLEWKADLTIVTVDPYAGAKADPNQRKGKERKKEKKRKEKENQRNPKKKKNRNDRRDLVVVVDIVDACDLSGLLEWDCRMKVLTRLKSPEHKAWSA